jgi:molybdate transport system substrate-binding protein
MRLLQLVLRCWLVALAFCLCWTLQRGHAGTDDEAGGQVTILAATSTVDALEEVRASFLKKHPVAKVELSFTASSTAAKQIVSGSPADLFISASDDWADYLEKKDLVAKRIDLLGNRLVIVVAKDSALKLSSPADLTSAAVRKIALADPESVPAGIYAKQALEKLKLWDAVQDKYVGGANVRQALQFVESGAAEAGVVYQTDATAAKKVKIAARIDPDLSDPIRYPLVLLKTGSKNKLAAAFFDFLLSSDAAKIFREHGFLVGDDLKPQRDERQSNQKQPNQKTAR